MIVLIFVLQAIILIIAISLLIKSFVYGDTKEAIINAIKDYFKIFQESISSINKTNTQTLAEIPKIAASANLIINTLGLIENKINTCLTIKSIGTPQIYLDSIVNLTDFEIYYFTPFDGYLSINADYCEIRFLDDSQIIIKKHLKKFFIKAKQAISIRNMKNVKYMHFDKK